MPVARMTEREQPYLPVPCAIHSEYELMVMRQQPVQITWQDADGVVHHSHLQPRDISTENHAEYLLGQDTEGLPLKIRLDSIRQYRILG